uniref:ribosomal protein L22 n=1 Tax=Terniopsis heterostaminata TaxID=2060756 RepID=UPI0028D56CDD|nr:ribosomal protein L22 [Terniopsis heterostaminata]WMV01967.1 ribosomal protein L22 [Terniopsis heterostaminata]
MKRKKKNNGEVYATSQYIHMSADKARRVIDQIRGRFCEEALMVLELLPYQASYQIFKLVYSATENANANAGFNKENLIISQAQVNEGPTSKKRRPQARGRSFMIKKRTCHITIVVKDILFRDEETKFLESEKNTDRTKENPKSLPGKVFK